MTTITHPTLAQVLSLASRLPATDKLLLIERLVPQVAQILTTNEMVHKDANELFIELDKLIADTATLGPNKLDSAEIIADMRR